MASAETNTGTVQPSQGVTSVQGQETQSTQQASGTQTTGTPVQQATDTQTTGAPAQQATDTQTTGTPAQQASDTQTTGTPVQQASGTQTTGTTAQQPSQVQDIKLLETITDHTTLIKGTSTPNGNMTVANASSTLDTSQADVNGNFSDNIPRQPANTILKISVSNGTNVFSIQVTVEAAPPIGWVMNNGQWYYLDSNGQKMTGWITDGGKKYFLDQSGVMKTGWLDFNGSRYYLQANGAALTGWLWYGGKWYFFKKDGSMAVGWALDGSVWYYFDKNGVMQTGWLWHGGHWYYLSKSGAMQVGWVYYGGHWYYLDKSGAMKTGWILDGGKWYFLNSDGTMKTGWVESGTDWYYLGSSGAVSSVILDAPLILQNPELPRGCEVTSLAMMLQDAGIRVSKMTLASQVKKDPTPYSVSGGQIYFGNPNVGFVGNMYNLSYHGLAVYHGPIALLARQYMPNRIIDFSGGNFEQIYNYLNNGTPVWVINNVLFDTVPSQYWQQWNTPEGKISITYKEHSVLVTGYDSNYIYFNDPLAGMKNRKVAISAFKRGWEQMGRQAISYK